MATAPLQAAVFTNLYSFSPLVATNATGVLTNSDGANPQAELTLVGRTLYGATTAGGIAGGGEIFKVDTDGSDFALLHSFADGGNPAGQVVVAGNDLFGTTKSGGTNGVGTVYRVGIDGTGFTNLYTFSPLNQTNAAGSYTNSDGANSTAALLLVQGILYGTAANGGTNGDGTVFKVNTNGTGFVVLHHFHGNDGRNPQAGLVLSGSTLFGTTEFGGSAGNGTVFALNTDGTGFTNLHSFAATLNLTNGEGAYVYSSLVSTGDTLYGTTLNGGLYGNGTIFSLRTNGMNFANLHDFDLANNYTNSDGIKPVGTLVLSGQTLYGTAQLGGTGLYGTVFSLSTNGSSFTNLYAFSTAVFSSALNAYTNSDGANPQAGLVLSDNSLYGTTLVGGNAGRGTVFVLSPGAIPLHLQSASPLVLTWGNPAFSLQAATNLGDAFVPVPSAPSPYTNTLAGRQQFFRLQAN
ncbi:MAG TPA: choice-of-anchor tandem repeat GloVer-containing protein [Verrucomicrobiae bacterium]|nr:choice-of-anchor tandem repeat GloVer-containing protein [Verrucomicrobiae bacterium]